MEDFSVVIVEDNKADSDVLSHFFQKFNSNCQITVIESFDMAIEFIESNNLYINLFILDVNLVGGNGLDLINHIKDNDFYKYSPIVIYSSNSDKDNIYRSYDLNANSFVIKSFINAEKLTEYWTTVAKTVNPNQDGQKM